MKRENCLDHIRCEAEHWARKVSSASSYGIKLFVYELGAGLVEIMTIGTAIRKNTQVTTISPQLIPQAIIRDRDTFFDETPLFGQAQRQRGLDRNSS
jgi:hypothetical protein